MCFVFNRVTEGATIITRDNNIYQFTTKRERGRNVHLIENIKGILTIYSSLLCLL